METSWFNDGNLLLLLVTLSLSLSLAGASFHFWRQWQFSKDAYFTVRMEVGRLQEQLLQLENDRARLLDEVSRAHSERARFLDERDSERSRLLDQLTQSKVERARLDELVLSHERALAQEKEILVMIKNEFNETFRGLAATALESNNRQFLDLAQQILSKENLQSKHDLEQRQLAIKDLVRPVRENLEKYQSYLSQIEKDRHSAFSTIESEIKRVANLSIELSRHTTALKDALKRPNVRGRWGEIQLKNCVELAGMSEYSDVCFQDSTNVGDGKRLVPDMTVRMPGGHQVIVDVKTPLDAFLASLESTSEELRNAELIRHGRLIKEHVVRLSQKAYSDHLEGSADFMVLFLPNESFLYAALETQPDLIEFALAKKILIATPPTLVGLLKVIRYGWNEAKLAENARLISEAGVELHKRLCDFVDSFMSIGVSISRAQAEYDRGLKRLESRVLVQARRMESLGVSSVKELKTSSFNPGESNPQPQLVAPRDSESAGQAIKDATSLSKNAFSGYEQSPFSLRPM